MGISIHSDDQLLLSEIEKDREDAFTILFKKYYTILCAFGSRYANKEITEECVQETMIWIWENRHLLIIESSLLSYLFKSVYHRILNKLNKANLQSKVESIFSSHQDLYENNDVCQIEELKTHILQAIQNLPESYRDAFVSQRIDGMTYEEIAQKNNVSVKTIDYRIQKALKILRIELKEYLPLIMLNL